MGIAKAIELFPAYMKKVSVTKQDDIADALLQAVWYYDVGAANIEKKEVAITKKRQRDNDIDKCKKKKRK
jgi:hypothetical protein